MGQIAEKELLVKDVVRLRAAEQQATEVADQIAPVRANLERMIGPTITRAMAARLLGVSQPAVDRWLASDDIPWVITTAGRRELPLRALIGLIEKVDQCRSAGDAHPLASALREARRAAQLLDVENLLPSTRFRVVKDSGHQRADLLGLVYHRAVATHLDDQIVQDARERLIRWRVERRIDSRHANSWERVLAQPVEKIAKLIARDDQRGRDLRQNSPLAGVLSEPERKRILEVVRDTT